ncbi:MAG: FemAB family XrtA/PEP-CTERM system-associated protein [Nitrospirales bacterium]
MRVDLQRKTVQRSAATATEVVLFDHPAAWNAYVSSHPRGTFYHRFEWLPLIARVFGHRVLPMAMVLGDQIVGIFPLVHMRSMLFGRVLVSMPFVNYGGLLGDSPEIEEALWNAAIQTAREHGLSSVEARHLTPHRFIDQAKQHKVGMTLNLAPTIEAQWKAFNAKLRNQIRKSELSSLSIRVGGATEVGAFYDVFARNMRDLGTPVYHRALFTKLFETFPEACRVFTVRDHETVVAAAIAIAHRGTLEVPWAASRRDALSLCPNHRLYWELIQHTIKAGFTQFDFGRSTPGSGPYKFKEQWGAGEVPQFWEYWTATGSLPNVTPHNPRYTLAVRLWKTLPLRVANTVGPWIVRNIP